MAQHKVWLGDFKEVNPLLNKAWELAEVEHRERDFIRILRLRGVAALKLDDLDEAQEHLHQALYRARKVNLVEEELPIMTALAELASFLHEKGNARELIEDVRVFAERGPYPLLNADALNVLAQIERDEGNTAAAIAAATQAYEKAWCDGPPYAYHWGLEAAKKHLDELGAPYPDMPPFDPSKYEPMPEVDINPPDELHV
jgi:tetratricopeptide (TPR) repeat protein